jgi:hypothetical protein
LHGGAPYGTGALNSRVHAAADRHVRAQKNFQLPIFDLRFGLA